MAPATVERRPTVIAPGKAALLYDGLCPLCRKSVALVQRLDWFGRLQFLDARDVERLPAHEPPLDPYRLLEEMHLITPDGRKVYHGFQVFRWLAWRLPLLWPLAPWLYLPGVPALGQRVYLSVARNRFKLVPCKDGVCAVPQFQAKGERPESAGDSLHKM